MKEFHSKPPRQPPRLSTQQTRGSTGSALTSPTTPSPTSVTFSAEQPSPSASASPSGCTSPVSPSSSSSPTKQTSFLVRWQFRGTQLLCSSIDYIRRQTELSPPSASLPDPQSSVVFFFCDSRAYSLQRSLLHSASKHFSSSSLSLLSAESHGTRIASATLYDDDAASFATVARFVAGAPVDIPPSRAGPIASAAERWVVAPLYYAAFYAAELAKSQHEWLGILLHWLPYLIEVRKSVHIMGDRSRKGIPLRFFKLFRQRAALITPQLLSLVTKCRKCGQGHEQSCALCTQLQGLSIWSALSDVRMLDYCVTITTICGSAEHSDKLRRLTSSSVSDSDSEKGATGRAFLGGCAVRIHPSDSDRPQTKGTRTGPWDVNLEMNDMKVSLSVKPHSQEKIGQLEEFDESNVIVSLHTYSTGCGCDLGCEKEKSAPCITDSVSEFEVKWGDLRSSSWTTEAMTEKERTQWRDRHEKDCALIIAARIHSRGVAKCKTVRSEIEWEKTADFGVKVDCADDDKDGDWIQGAQLICPCRRCRLPLSA